MSPRILNDFRVQLVQVLDNDDGPDKGWYSYVNIIVIFIFILTLVVEFRFQNTYQQYVELYSKLELYALIFFSIDFSARIVCYERRGKYLLSFYGLIDFLTVAIGLLSIIFPVLSGSSALLRTPEQ